MTPLLCSDLDGTLLGDAPALRRFHDAWRAFHRATGARLAYVTGRSVPDVLALLAATPDLPAPDLIAGDVGTRLYDPRTGCDDPILRATFDPGWDRAAVEALLGRHPGLVRQPEWVQSAYKSSWFTDPDAPLPLPTLRALLDDAGLRCRVILSGGHLVDVLPANGGKGHAVTRILSRLGITPEHTLVAGDSGNDLDLFLVPGVRGVVVGNALPELTRALPSPVLPRVRFARAGHADGVADECRHAFGDAFP